MEGEEVAVGEYLHKQRKFFEEGLKAVRLENDSWRLVLLPEWNGKVVEMTYKPTGRNVIQAARGLSRFRYEDWIRQGEGPNSHRILPFEVKAQDHEATLTLTTADGTRLERHITLAGEAIRFEMAMTAGAARTFDAQVHPEYDTVFAL